MTILVCLVRKIKTKRYSTTKFSLRDRGKPYIPIIQRYPNLCFERSFQDIVIGTAIATVAAADRDHGPDGTILFALIDGDSEGRFQIDPKSGVIELRKQLDRETTEVYSLTIRATDQGVPSLSSTVTVHVKLLDVNDNPPLCNHSSYVIELAENFTVNGTVLHLQCSDADEGENSAVSYNISSGKITVVHSSFLLFF